MTFRQNVLRAMADVNAKWSDMENACDVDAMTFCEWVNEFSEPSDEQVEMIAEFLRTINYEWE